MTSTKEWAVSSTSGSLNQGQGYLQIFPGEYSYIVEEYNYRRSEAASAFGVEITRINDFHAADISKGDGKTFYRYLHAFYTYGGLGAVVRVWLSRIEDTTEGDGRTDDLNRGRKGDYLYLCWEYEKNCWFAV